jgi:hypothetical protein
MRFRPRPEGHGCSEHPWRISLLAAASAGQPSPHGSPPAPGPIAGEAAPSRSTAPLAQAAAWLGSAANPGHTGANQEARSERVP